ncbi:MAG: MATE family efflux transporter [Gammaproteobacteria bacterium]|nr:MATE family efflux transporter [Gammaproteobacteria bacterium]
MKHHIDRRTILLIAWPIIVSNLSTPLLGLVDTAVIGNLGNPALIGAIAIGAMIFSFLYWGFGFLRMGTTGLIAQAIGAGDLIEIKASLYRASLLALAIGLFLVLLQWPISTFAFSIIDGSNAVEEAAATYFIIRIWAAPVSLLHLALMGYLLGQQKSTAILWIQLLLNGTNILLDFVFVVGLDWGVAGIASATVIAEIIAVVAGLLVVNSHLKLHYGTTQISLKDLLELKALKRMLSVNRDIMIRTLCLIFALAWFTNEGASRGDVLLATNAILMQFVTFAAFFLDGYALAAESLTGNAVGARNPKQLDLTLRYISELGRITSCLLTIVFWLVGPLTIDILTTAEDVREMARVFLPWAIAAPIVSLWCFLLDGVFIGATCTREMRNAMIASLLVYLLAWYYLAPTYDNHGLWMSLMIYYIARAVTLFAYLGRVRAVTAGTP